ncbi:MAG: 30S ribosomal protein S8 [Candidatus Paceibacterota bacterium]
MYIDLITRIKNAEAVNKRYVKIPYTKMDRSVAELLEKQGFLKKAEVKGRSIKKIIKIFPNYDKKIQGIKFLSKPSLRKYSGVEDLRYVKGGYGTLVLSTSKGILTGREARKQKVGGQILFEIW